MVTPGHFLFWLKFHFACLYQFLSEWDTLNPNAKSKCDFEVKFCQNLTFDPYHWRSFFGILKKRLYSRP
jgi:hypothetical protein